MKHLNAQIRSESFKGSLKKNVTGKLNEVIKNMTTASVFSALCDVGVAVLCQSGGGLTEARAGQQLYSYASQLWGTVLFLMTSSSQLGHCGRTEVLWCPTVDLGGGQRRGWPAETQPA